MGENVIFTNQQPNDQSNTGQAGPDPIAGQQQPSVPQHTQPAPEMQVQPGMENEPPPSTEPPVDETGSDTSDVPPPSGIAGLLANSLLKKILIGMGIFIVLIILIILIIPKNPKGKDVTLVWWGLWEDNATIQPVIDDFEKQNPHIKIQYIKQDPEKYRDTLLARIGNGSGPDIFRYHNTWVPMLSNVLAPLPQDVISADDFKKDYYPVIQKDLTQNGAIYGIPLGIDSLALFVNTDLLKAAGLTAPKDWNQFTEAAKKMTVKDKDTLKIQTAGAALGTYGNVLHAPDILSVMFLQQGIDLKKIIVATDDLAAAITFYTAFAKGNDGVWDSSLDNSQLAFAKGELAMYFGFSWDIFTIEQLKKNNNFKYEIHPVPSLVGGASITVASYWAEGVSARGKNQKEAMQFMHYLTQKETLQKLYTESSKTRSFGEPYPRVDMAEELKDNSLIYPFISQLDNAGSSYFASNTQDGDTGLNKQANSYLENAINAIINNNSSVDSEVAKLQLGVGQVLQTYGIEK
jgi:multiple sugar transport system substrate-binding protein